jgi:hypothetical protein
MQITRMSFSDTVDGQLGALRLIVARRVAGQRLRYLLGRARLVTDVCQLWPVSVSLANAAA